MSQFKENYPAMYERNIVMAKFIHLYNVPMKAMYLLTNYISPTEGIKIDIKPKRNSEKKLLIAEELFAEYVSLDKGRIEQEKKCYEEGLQ